VDVLEGAAKFRCDPAGTWLAFRSAMSELHNETADGSGERKSVFVDEAAVRLGVSRRTVYYRIREGKLQTIRTPGGSQRVLLESIEVLRRQKVSE